MAIMEVYSKKINFADKLFLEVTIDYNSDKKAFVARALKMAQKVYSGGIVMQEYCPGEDTIAAAYISKVNRRTKKNTQAAIISGLSFISGQITVTEKLPESAKPVIKQALHELLAGQVKQQ